MPFDLRRAAGLPIRFIARNDVDYAVPADPEVDVLAQMLVLERAIRGQADDIDVTEAVVRGKEIIVSLASEHRDTWLCTVCDAHVDACSCDRSGRPVDDIPLGVGDVLKLFGLITGGESVAQEVAEALTSGRGALSPEEADARIDDDADEDDGGSGARGPLASKKPSRGRSARSAPSTAGRRTTGEG